MMPGASGSNPSRRDAIGIRVDEDAVRVDAIDRVARALDELTEARLALGERLLDLPCAW